MSAIAIPDVLGRFVITTLTFEDLASLVVRSSEQQQGQVPTCFSVVSLLFAAEFDLSQSILPACSNLKDSGLEWWRKRERPFP